MLIEDIIREQTQAQKIVGILPGRYQPPHKGHMQAWRWMEDNFDEAYISTSDKVDPPRSPFNFQEKKQLFVHAGVPAKNVIQTKSPYRSDEIVSKYDPEKTVVVFGVSQKDMEEDPRFSFKPKKDGSLGYLQPYAENQDDLKPLSQHGYVIVVPTMEFTVLGEPMRSATEFRQNFSQADEKTQARMIEDLYGSYDKNIHKLMRSKIV